MQLYILYIDLYTSIFMVKWATFTCLQNDKRKVRSSTLHQANVLLCFMQFMVYIFWGKIYTMYRSKHYYSFKSLKKKVHFYQLLQVQFTVQTQFRKKKRNVGTVKRPQKYIHCTNNYPFYRSNLANSYMYTCNRCVKHFGRAFYSCRVTSSE